MNETLSVPEDYLLDVCRVIRAGLKVERVPREVRQQLLKWCGEMEEYIRAE